ncbi:hypothetical protein P4S72_05685 [Vibrio sp. PP-XX7]
MEEVLELYAQPANPKEPVPAKPGQPERIDYEYRREAVANIFLMYDRHNGWRHAKASIEWLFDVDKARSKLHRAYNELTIQN